MSETKEKLRAVNAVMPPNEVRALHAMAKSMGITVTMVLRMLVREHLMGDPIKFPEKV